METPPWKDWNAAVKRNMVELIKQSRYPFVPSELQAKVLQFWDCPPDLDLFWDGSSSKRHLLPAKYREIVGPSGNPTKDHDLLSILEKCLPDYILCNLCKRLHTVDSAYLKGEHRNFECRRKDAEGYGDVFIYPTFRYPVFQLAMKHWREGLDYEKDLKALSYNNIIREDSYTHQCTATPRIVNDSLLVRVQHILVLPLGETLFPTDAQVTICPHYDALEVDYGTYERGLYEARPAKSTLIECSHMYKRFESTHHKPTGHYGWLLYLGKISSARLLTCWCCRTEVQVSVERQGDNRVFVVTKWQDLGKGLDVDDIVYRTHLYSPQANPLGLGFDHLRSSQMPRSEDEQIMLREIRASETEKLREICPHETIGAIRSAFGDGEDSKFDSDIANVPKPEEPKAKNCKSTLKMRNTWKDLTRFSATNHELKDGPRDKKGDHRVDNRGRPPPYQAR